MMQKKKQQCLNEMLQTTVINQAGPLKPSDFEPIKDNEIGQRQMMRPSVSFWKDAILRISKDRAAIVCLVVLALIIIGAIFIPIFSPFDYATQNIAFTNKAPMSVDPINGAIHFFGTDKLGRDIFVRIWCGAQVSLTVAVAVALIDCFFGVIYGGIAGYFGGKTDIIMMRIVDVLGGIPYLMVVILLMTVLPRGIISIIIAYTLIGWTGMARLVRGQVINLSQQEFLIAVKTMGAKPSRIIINHLMPNLLSVIIVNITLDIPDVIFTEAFLSMLGLGIAPPKASWGILANEGISVFQNQPLQLLFPAVFICLTMLAFNILGDHLRDALDPKLRR